MFKAYFCQKKGDHRKKGWPRMVLTYDLPTPSILQKEAFLAKYGFNI